MTRICRGSSRGREPASNEIGVRRAVPGERSDVFCGRHAREKHGALREMVRGEMPWPD